MTAWAWARRDIMCVSVPASSGGCGREHRRPEHRGQLVADWGLDCEPCAGFLLGRGRQPVIQFTPGDPRNGIPPQQRRVSPGDPCWSGTPEDIPMTPDEIRHRTMSKARAARGRDEASSRAIAALMGAHAPGELMSVLSGGTPFIAATNGDRVRCPQGHDNHRGMDYCGRCGSRLGEQDAVEQAIAAIKSSVAVTDTAAEACEAEEAA